MGRKTKSNLDHNLKGSLSELNRWISSWKIKVIKLKSNDDHNVIKG